MSTLPELLNTEDPRSEAEIGKEALVKIFEALAKYQEDPEEFGLISEFGVRQSHNFYYFIHNPCNTVFRMANFAVTPRSAARKAVEHLQNCPATKASSTTPQQQ